MENYKRPGFHSINAYLLAKDANKLLSFLKEVFDGEVIFRADKPDGTLGHSELQIGDSRVSIAEASDEWKPMPAMIYAFVPDTDATYAKAMAAGAKEVHAPKDMEYGERSGGFWDPAGNQWWIATAFPDTDDAKVAQASQDWADKQEVK